ECGDDFDCLEEDTYCEPTIGRCLANPSPPLCEVRPDFDEVALDIEWHWEGVDVGGAFYANIIAAPVVGDVSGDGIPDVVVPVYRSSSLGDTVLVAIHGRTGETLWAAEGSLAAGSQSTPAVANLDPSDEALEVVAYTNGDDLVVLDGDGMTELARVVDAAGPNYGNPSVHDLEGDGTPDVVLGANAWAFEPMGGGFTLRERFTSNDCGLSGSVIDSVVANLDDDPELEITCGGVAYDTDGGLLWGSAGTVGFAAVADLDLDGAPEVVMVRSGQVSVRDGATGALRMGTGGSWFDGELPIPAGGVGGPPTIADFDGDGLPEISAAGRGAYAVYDPDCIDTPIAGREAGTCDRMDGTTGAIRWSAPVQDLSSSRTGSSLFDFQGDGVAEVVYNDECFLHVFDGRRGDELLMEPFANSSRTGSEYPLVVDVDRDGNSEIVVPANNDQIARDNCRASWRDVFGYASDDEIPERFRDGTQGIYALGDPADRWVRTRPVWNQYAYAVTHVGDRGDVPAAPPENWSVEGLNNFRQNVQGEGVFNAPNLTVELDIVAACGRGEIRISALVRNEGSRGVPAGVPVEIVQTAPAPEASIAMLMTTVPLLPGGSERLTAVATEVPSDTDLTFEARVDGDEATSTITECVEDDNTAMGTEMCPGLL
ncbi:MAG TPA: VCBS repeat-containing protein, partial [Polyangiaceae bacterium LLY-WYZ-15_(1-7)]|nr:VCBS repeat-containing protein [Polyangiaceae bacterium LLY-WYZ-15_(1-7)]